jgi:phosphoribosyl 1,2-cyclic phosphate phosphodiesterase
MEKPSDERRATEEVRVADPVQLTFLGTGTSHGIPVIGCPCAVCRSSDPHNQRYRPSVLIEWAGKTILIDTPPELRLQLLRAEVRHLDALLYTHTHADHLFGLDDVRVFNQRSGHATPVYGSRETLANLRRQFFYVFTEESVGGGKPQLELRAIDPLDQTVQVAGLPVQPVPVEHGPTTVLGYRFGDLAYVTDTNRIPEVSLARLQGLDVLVLDALREQRHPTHFSLGEALAVVERLAPRQTYFTHICHDLDHAATNRRLPPGVALAYDGLRIRSGPRPVG